MDQEKFFSEVRRTLFRGHLKQSQMDGIQEDLEGCERHGVTDLDSVAYVLATDFHETGQRMQPVRETFATTDAQAVSRLNNAFSAGRLPWVSKPYWHKDENGQHAYGRGKVQLTHGYNYQKMDEALGLNGALVRDYDLALDPDVSTDILVVGMRDGVFTGKKLGQYFGPNDDPLGDSIEARRIVNGKDRAKLIAGYAQKFERALRNAGFDETEEDEDMARNPTARPVGASAPRVTSIRIDRRWLTKGRLKDIQLQLYKLGYTEVGHADGLWGGRTEGAIRTFWKERGVPPKAQVVDAAFRARLMQASPRAIPKSRKEMTMGELQKRGSTTIPIGKGGLATTAGGAVVAGGGVIKTIQENRDTVIDTVNQARDPVEWLWGMMGSALLWALALVAFVGVGYFIWRMMKNRLRDEQTGKTITNPVRIDELRERDPDDDELVVDEPVFREEEDLDEDELILPEEETVSRPA